MENQKIEETKTNKKCFIIMPISDPTGYEKGHFKRVYEDIFIPACEEAGFSAIRADDINETGMIHLDILKSLLNADMAICDLSSCNPNVLFELGIRQAFDKPTVLVQETGNKQIFDIAPLKYCTYRKELLYREVLEDQNNLVEFLTNTNQSYVNGDAVNSIVKLLQINKATKNESDNTADSSVMYQYILSEIQELKKTVRKVNHLPVSNEDNNYDRILISLQQLSEIVNSGAPSSIFMRNYISIRENILLLPDSEIKSMFVEKIESIRKEWEKFNQ